MATKVDNILLLVLGQLVTLCHAEECWNGNHFVSCWSRYCCDPFKDDGKCCDKPYTPDFFKTSKTIPIVFFSVFGLLIFSVSVYRCCRLIRDKTSSQMSQPGGHNYQPIPGQNVRDTSYQPESEPQYGRPPPPLVPQYGRPPPHSVPQYGRPPPYKEHETTSFTDPPPPYHV